MSEVAARERLRYRLLTGPDDRTFCERVSAALADGYELHGSPSITVGRRAGRRGPGGRAARGRGVSEPRDGWRPDTRAVRAGLDRSGFEETSEALYLTSGLRLRPGGGRRGRLRR